MMNLVVERSRRRRGLIARLVLLVTVCTFGISLGATRAQAEDDMGVPADIACSGMLKDYLKGRKGESAPCNESNFEFIMIPRSCPKLVRDKAQKAHALCLQVKATQKDYDDCNQAASVDTGIAGCTRVVNDQSQAAIDRVAALVQRGNIMVPKKNYAEALSDYQRAIKLDPTSLLPYAARAIVYWKEADIEQDAHAGVAWEDRKKAVADYRKAGMLDAAKLSEMTAASPELKKISVAASKPTPPRPKKAVPMYE